MIQLLITPIPISGDLRITMSVVLLGIIILGLIFIPKAIKYRKRLLDTPEPEEPEKENIEDVVMMIVDESETTATDEPEPDNQG